MIGPQEILRWAESRYYDYLRSLIDICAEVDCPSFFPLRKGQIGKVPANATPEQFLSMVKPLIDASKNTTGSGYTVVLVEHQRRKRSLQNEPGGVEFTNEADYLSYLNRKNEVKSFKDDTAAILKVFPDAYAVIREQPKLVIDYHGSWGGILEVISYLCQHPRPQCYIRALPVGVHTKFIVNHSVPIEKLLNILPETQYMAEASTFEERCGFLKDEPSVRGRFLCENLMHIMNFPCADIRLRLGTWANQFSLPPGTSVLVCENKTNFLALPPIPNVLALWGQGGAVSGYLARMKWLHSVKLFYWGDLDPYGFAILARLRAVFPHTRSVLMGFPLVKQYHAQLSAAKLPLAGIAYENLTSEETTAAHELSYLGKGLEQEKLLFSDAIQTILSVINCDYS